MSNKDKNSSFKVHQKWIVYINSLILYLVAYVVILIGLAILVLSLFRDSFGGVVTAIIIASVMILWGIICIIVVNILSKHIMKRLNSKK